MKPQDIVFIIFLLLFIFLKKPKLTISAGIFCLLLSVPLYAKWIFFTAERLTIYAAGFFLLAILVFMLQLRDNK